MAIFIAPATVGGGCKFLQHAAIFEFMLSHVQSDLPLVDRSSVMALNLSEWFHFFGYFIVRVVMAYSEMYGLSQNVRYLIELPIIRTHSAPFCLKRCLKSPVCMT